MKNIQLKIIAGKFKGMSISSYSDNTRETSHMVRGAVFNMLYPISGIGLDLFAGSGAYGFEALSRGLCEVYLNDSDTLAFKALQDNNNKLNAQAILTQKDYRLCVKDLIQMNLQLDYIFLDPPYEMDIHPIIDLVLPLLKSTGSIIAETSKEIRINLDQIQVLKTKIHGIKAIHIIKKAE